MSNMTKIALSAAIILSTALSALTAANAGATREQASGTSVLAPFLTIKFESHAHHCSRC
jgi:hypothetical protein